MKGAIQKKIPMSEHQGSPIMFTSRVGAVCVCLACLAANPASASEFYSYTGNNYALVFGGAPPYDTSMRVTATLEFASSLPPNLVDADVIPIGFLFDDGVNTITENSDIEEQAFRFSTDAVGNITFWNVSAKTALPFPSNVGDQQWEIATLNTTSGTQTDFGSISTCVIDSSCGIFEVESGRNDDNPGTWTVVPAPLTTLAAASLPTSRSIQLGSTATAFATIINAGTAAATSCDITPLTVVPGAFVYQTTDPATNALIGNPDTPVDIAAGALQTFLFAFTPTVEIVPTDVELGYDCTNTEPAPVTLGLNTLLLSASSTPVPDIVALSATPTGDGIVALPGDTGANAFAVATVNVGSTDTITAAADTGTATLPVTLLICESIPATGECLSAPAASVTTSINAGATPTFSIFVTGTGTVPFDPANNRIVVEFKDAGGVVRGSTSVAVRTL
jgi:hypothetical protein